MTVELFFEHAYLRNCKTYVTDILPYGLELEQTVFFPTQDGFPGDAGQIYNQAGTAFNTMGTILNRDNGRPIHILEKGKDAFEVGEAVTGVLDWQRRYQHMQMHSCLHLLCSMLEGKPISKSINGMVGKINLEIETKINAAEVEDELNALCKKNLQVKTYAVDVSKITHEQRFVQQSKVEELGEFVRVVEIEGLGYQVCNALHVRSTKEILPVTIRKIEKSNRTCRRISIEFSSNAIEDQRHFQPSSVYSS